MKIPKLQITNNEMHEAVGQWLARKGIQITVTEVNFDGYPSKGYNITCEDRQWPTVDEVSPFTKEELKAIRHAVKSANSLKEDIHDDYIPTKDPQE